EPCQTPSHTRFAPDKKKHGGPPGDSPRTPFANYRNRRLRQRGGASGAYPFCCNFFVQFLCDIINMVRLEDGYPRRAYETTDCRGLLYSARTRENPMVNPHISFSEGAEPEARPRRHIVSAAPIAEPVQDVLYEALL